MLSPSRELLEMFQGGNASLVLLVVKATLILLGALLVTFSMQRAAAGARHVVWLVSLGALLLVPALTVWGPIRIRVLPPPGTTREPALLEPAPTATAHPAIALRGSVAENTAVAAPTSPGVAAAPSSAPAPDSRITAVAWLHNADWLTLLLTLWAGVAVAIAAALAFATLSLRRVVRASTPLATQDWLNAVWEVSDRLGLDRAPRLLQSSDLKMPFACGVWNPTVVLPAECNRWSDERRTAVLLHELAHVRRRDLLGHTLGRIACAVYWFHPLVWTAARRLRSESERACDDLALTCGTGAADYAEHLLDIVTSVRRDRTPLVALAMARRKEFEGRMLAILDPQLERALPRPWKTAALGGSIGALALLLGAAAPALREGRMQVAAAAPNGVSTMVLATRQARAVDTIHGVNATAPDPVRTTVPTTASRTTRYGSATEVAPLGEISAQLRQLLATSDSIGGNAARASNPDERAELLVKVLRTDSSSQLRRTAAWGLSRYVTEPVASDALVAALEHDGSAPVRETAAWSLARGRDSNAAITRALGAALRTDASDSVRATAAWALGSVGSGTSTAVLTSALGDRSAAVRERAVWALGRSRTEHAPDALVALLRDSDPAVRRITAWCLFQIRDPGTIPALQSALHLERDSELQVDYVRALSAMGASALGAVRSLLESPDAKIKSMAVNALAGGRGAGPWPWPWPDPRPWPDSRPFPM